MTYQRVRNRNGLMHRKPVGDSDPYWRGETSFLPPSPGALIGDLNRMERDYCEPEFPERPFASRERGSDPAHEVSRLSGVSVEDVRKVMRCVFFEQV